jgi:hypothetical protein
MRASSRRAVLEYLSVATLYGALAVWFTWPMARTATTAIGGHRVLLADDYHFLWLLQWVARALVSAPSTLFDGNVMHPMPRVVAGADHLLGDQPIFGLVLAGSGNPVLAFNALVLTSFVLCGTTMYLLIRRWTGSRVAALTAGLAFAFLPWRVDIARVRLLQQYYYPLIVLLVDRAAVSGRVRDGLLAAAVLAMQVLCSYYLGYQAYMIAAAVVFAHVVGRGWRAVFAARAAVATALLGPLVVILPLSLPYILAETGGELDAAKSAAHGTRVREFVEAVGKSSALYGSFIGWGTLAVGSLGLLGLAAWRTDRIRWVRTLALLLIGATGLALAPGSEGFLDGWVSPHRWLEVLLPGFARMRAPTRFAMLSGFAMSALVGLAVAGMLRGGSRARQCVATTIVLVAVLTPLTRLPAVGITPIPTGASMPPVYAWLAEHGDGGPLLELPITSRLADPDLAAARAMYFSTRHWLPLLNGYTSYRPPAYRLFEAYAAQLPCREALQTLVDCTGLRWILLHGRQPGRGLDGAPGLRRIGEFPTDAQRADFLYEATLAPQPRACTGALPAADRTLDGHPASRLPELAGTLAVRSLRTDGPPGASLPAQIVVRNDGPAVWPGTALRDGPRIRVEIRWKDEAGRAAEKPQSIALPRDAEPGASLAFAAWVDVPARPGRYRLQAALRQGTDGGPPPLRWETSFLVRPRNVPGDVPAGRRPAS